MSAIEVNSESCNDSEIESCLQVLVDEIVGGLIDAGLSDDRVELIHNRCTDVVEVVADKFDSLRDRVDELEMKTSENSSEVEIGEKRMDALSLRIDNVQDEVEEVESSTSGDDSEVEKDDSCRAADNSVVARTPLEQVVGLPEDVAESELSANQFRARFVAQDLKEYCSRAPAGHVISSGDISTVIRAGTDAKGHTETVKRVMSFLADLGGEAVHVVKRRGVKRLVFTEDAADRLEAVASESQRGDGVGGGKPVAV